MFVCFQQLGLFTVGHMSTLRGPTIEKVFLISAPAPYHPISVRVCDSLGHDSEHRVVTADARADLLVVLLGVTHLVELRLKRNKEFNCLNFKNAHYRPNENVYFQTHI